jgi:hypothetical protein
MALDASSKAMLEVLSQLKSASACLSDIMDNASAGNKPPESTYKSLLSAPPAMELDPEGLACGFGDMMAIYTFHSALRAMTKGSDGDSTSSGNLQGG